MASTLKGKLFYASTPKGHLFKSIIDSMSLALDRTSLKFTKKGIFHRKANNAGSVLFDVMFPRANFLSYYCRKRHYFSINLNHLQKMIGNVKKKDSIVIYIAKDKPNKLAIVILPSDSRSGPNSRTETVFITITKEEEFMVDGLPEIYTDEKTKKETKVYGSPMVINAAEFQKLKGMIKIAGTKPIQIEIQKSNYLSFYTDSGELYGNKVEFGQIVDHPESDYTDSDSEDWSDEHSGESEDEQSDVEDEDEQSDTDEDDSNKSKKMHDDDEIKELYQAYFDKKMMSILLKLPSSGQQIQFFSPKILGYPLKVKLCATNLGKVTVYVKDTERLKFEKSEKTTKK